MAKKENFTTARVNDYPCEPGKQQTLYWDAVERGLGLRVTASGARTYVFESRLFGKTVRIKIGKEGAGSQAWTLDRARKQAAELRVQINKGIDPREVRAAARAAHEARQAAVRRKTATVAEAWTIYVEHLGRTSSPKTRNPRSASYINDHRKLAAPGGALAKRGGRKTVRGPLYPLMALPLGDLTGKHVAAWLEKETATRPTSAGYAFRLLKAFVRWCDGQDEYKGLIPADCVTSAAVRGAVPASNVKEDDCLQREQLVAWFAAVRALPNPVLSAYLQGLLITGARREELAALRWDDVNFAWGSLQLRDKVRTQTGRVIPLTPYLRSLLAALPRRNAWVFSSPSAADGRIAEPRYAHNQVLTRAGMPHVTLHGLRRSFSTLAEWVEAPAGIIAQIQGHTKSAIAERHYKRRSLDLLRMWHDKIEAWMLQQAGIAFEPAETMGLRIINGRNTSADQGQAPDYLRT